MVQTVRSQSFSKENRLLNAVPPLFVLMTLASPIVWDHHGFSPPLPFLPMLKRIHSPAAWTWFGFAISSNSSYPPSTSSPGRMVASSRR